MPKSRPFPRVVHEVDFCVVGGGMAGLAAALSAARHGAKVVLMHDRPVLGGNASSECRVHICGADRHNSKPNLRETGILEELRLTNLRRNPNRSFSIWDTVLYEAVLAEPNITMLLNCSCCDAKTQDGRVVSVTGWQTTTQLRHVVRAKIYADCSGDAVLAPRVGAEFRVGREGRDEFGESLAPAKADRKTMGMTCLFQAREYPTPQPFEPPTWAHRFDSCDHLPYGPKEHRWFQMGYWWIELGGQHDSIRDTEKLRDELLKIVYGVWDHVKNRCGHKADAANWALDWVQFLPAKRESRRYVGQHVLTQNDLAGGGQFDDVVAYGGWEMDDHTPTGFWGVREGHAATKFNPTPSPYGIPYRCLYSRNIANLMFAGRCHSATHMAMSSTRVMGTCVSMGQAVGTAAAMAVRLGVDPHGVLPKVSELQQELLADDCYLPRVWSCLPDLTMGAKLTASQGKAEPIRDGWARQIGDDSHAWTHSPGDWVAYEFNSPQLVTQATLVLDSAMELDPQMSLHSVSRGKPWELPHVLPKAFRLEGLVGGAWQTVAEVADNHQRFVRVPIGRELAGLRYVLQATRGADATRLYSFFVE